MIEATTAPATRVPVLEPIPPPPRQPELIYVDAGSAPPTIKLWLHDDEIDELDYTDAFRAPQYVEIGLVGNAEEIAEDLEAAAEWLRSFPKTTRNWYITADD